MRKCEHCSNEINRGHVMFEEEFYLCEKCFSKLYSEKFAQELYENGLQYYTEWEEEDNGNWC